MKLKKWPFYETDELDAVYKVLYENKNPKKVFLDLTEKLD